MGVMTGFHAGEEDRKKEEQVGEEMGRGKGRREEKERGEEAGAPLPLRLQSKATLALVL